MLAPSIACLVCPARPASDTNGLVTKPVVSAVASLLASQPAECCLVFGLDANVYLEEKAGTQSVADFLSHCQGLGWRSCWPDDMPMTSCITTCNARTYLQPQLNSHQERGQTSQGGSESKGPHFSESVGCGSRGLLQGQHRRQAV